MATVTSTFPTNERGLALGLNAVIVALGVAAVLMLTPLPLTLAVVAPLSGALADWLSSRWLSPIGLALACLGLFLLSQLNAHSAPLDTIWRLTVIGIETNSS